MLPPRHGPRPLLRDLLPHRVVHLLPDVRADRLGEERDGRDGAGVRVDERGLARGPRREELCGGRGADEARVRDAGELDAGDVARRCVYSWVFFLLLVSGF